MPGTVDIFTPELCGVARGPGRDATDEGDTGVDVVDSVSDTLVRNKDSPALFVEPPFVACSRHADTAQQ